MLSLRYDLTVPFARFLAVHSVGNIKRYHIGKVYRRDNPQLSRGRYREFYQCDFDIAGTFPLMVADAEAVTVCAEILTDLPIGEFCIKLNHRRLLDSIFDLCGCPPDKFRTICSAVDKLDKEPWSEVYTHARARVPPPPFLPRESPAEEGVPSLASQVRREMVDDKGLDAAVADRIGEFVQLKSAQGSPAELRARIAPMFGGHAGALAALAELDTLFEYLDAMGSAHAVSFDLSLARGLDYYTGVIYEAVIMDGTSTVGSIAAGGRCDGRASPAARARAAFPPPRARILARGCEREAS